MNMKNMKKFFTLSRRAEGFTLVELIVVIAILAILGGVAVPAYSGYITKTNKTADQTLVSDVADALTLYYYDNLDTELAYVVLGTEDAAAYNPADADDAAYAAGAAAMKAVFGEGWKDTVVLKCGDWTAGGSMTTAAMNSDYAEYVNGSSYLTGSTPTELLDQVGDLTTAATQLMSKMNVGEQYNTIKANLFGNDDERLKATCDEYGITVNVDDRGVYSFGDDVTTSQMANLLVLGSADQIGNSNGSSELQGLVMEYASYTAYANANPNDTAIQTAYANLNSSLASGNVSSAFNTFESVMGQGYTDYYNSEKGETDAAAFVSIMQAVAAADVTDADMRNGDLFTSSKVADYFDTYIAAAKAAQNLPDNLKDLISQGYVIVFMYGGDGRAITDCSANDALLR